MRQTVSERKREILIRSAESRLGVVESLDSTMRSAGRTWEIVRVPRRVARWGMYAGGGLLGVLLLRRLFSSGHHVASVAAPAVAPQSRGAASLLGSALVQLLPVLVVPWLKSQIQGANNGGENLLTRLHPSRILFRWLGLEK